MDFLRKSILLSKQNGYGDSKKAKFCAEGNQREIWSKSNCWHALVVNTIALVHGRAFLGSF